MGVSRLTTVCAVAALLAVCVTLASAAPPRGVQVEPQFAKPPVRHAYRPPAAEDEYAYYYPHGEEEDHSSYEYNQYSSREYRHDAPDYYEQQYDNKDSDSYSGYERRPSYSRYYEEDPERSAYKQQDDNELLPPSVRNIAEKLPATDTAKPLPAV